MDSSKDINVDEQDIDPDSVLNFWRMMLELRKQYEGTFVYGHFELLDAKNDKTFCYTKQSLNGKHIIFVALNFSGQEQPFEVPKALGEKPEVLISALVSNRPRKDHALEPWEGRIYANLSSS